MKIGHEGVGGDTHEEHIVLQMVLVNLLGFKFIEWNPEFGCPRDVFPRYQYFPLHQQKLLFCVVCWLIVL